VEFEKNRNPLLQTFSVPALRKVREERGNHFVGGASEIEGRATLSLRGNSTHALLAGSFLRLQRLDVEEACGEAQVHASQSSQARSGGFAGGMALGQLPFLLPGRARAGAGKRRLGKTSFAPRVA
jgi:hypothetical protein